MRHSQVSMSLAYGKVIAKSVAEQVDKLADELGSMIGPKSEIIGDKWWARTDSNCGPPACEAGALTN
jgi:hypothetical protein